MYPKSLQRLIEDFKTLPGVGEKTAERYALAMLSKQKEDAERFAQDLIDVKQNIKRCKVCGNMTEDDLCDICKDSSRDNSVICVVQNPRDISSIERTGYSGKYHVLNGVISPSKGILPSDINLDTLEGRIDDQVREVIIATNPNLDGETTSLYISKMLKDKVTVTRLAHGIPMGGSLDYIDELTLIKAMEGRTKE